MDKVKVLMADLKVDQASVIVDAVERCYGYGNLTSRPMKGMPGRFEVVYPDHKEYGLHAVDKLKYTAFAHGLFYGQEAVKEGWLA